MSFTWPWRIVDNPQRLGGLLAMVLLTPARFLAEVGVDSLSSRVFYLQLPFQHPPLDLVLLLTLPTMVWAWILGNCGGRAWQHWKNENPQVARHTLRHAGLLCVLLNMTISVIFAGIVMSFGTDIEDTHLKMVLALRLLTNVSLQASLLMFGVSFFWPRAEEEKVQVTENLRL